MRSPAVLDFHLSKQRCCFILLGNTEDTQFATNPEFDPLENVFNSQSSAMCNVIFAGTDENVIRRDSLRGAGLLIGKDVRVEFFSF
jgi:hypothetical protein